MRPFNARVVGAPAPLFALIVFLLVCGTTQTVHAQRSPGVSDGGAPTSGEVVSGGPAWDPPIGTTPIYSGSSDDDDRGS